VRRLVAAGGLAIVVCACLLLFSGAASARQADSLAVTGTRIPNSNNIQFQANDTSPFTGLDFEGGSNNSITAISDTSDPGATCNLTPTNNGGGCTFKTPVTSATILTTWNGTIPTVVYGIVINGGSTAPFTAPVTMGTPACDWTVQFTSAPQMVFQAPISYAILVTNRGSGSCPATVLQTSAAFDSRAFGTTSAMPSLNVPALAPGGAVAFYPKVESVTLTTKADAALDASGLSLHVTAAMPQDADGGSDESAGATTVLTAKTAKFEPAGSDTTGASCTRNDAGSCKFSLYIFITPSVVRGLRQAAAAKPVEIGSARGTIKRGKRGTLRYKLNKTGRTLEKKTHKLPVTLIGTRKQGSVSTFIKGRVTLR
jgi:hypothetical protein